MARKKLHILKAPLHSYISVSLRYYVREQSAALEISESQYVEYAIARAQGYAHDEALTMISPGNKSRNIEKSALPKNMEMLEIESEYNRRRAQSLKDFTEGYESLKAKYPPDKPPVYTEPTLEEFTAYYLKEKHKASVRDLNYQKMPSDMAAFQTELRNLNDIMLQRRHTEEEARRWFYLGRVVNSFLETGEDIRDQLEEPTSD